MTDREKLTALLDEFGVEWTAGPIQNLGGQTRSTGAPVILDANTRKVDGYMGFLAYWTFSPDGEFIDVGIWE